MSYTINYEGDSTEHLAAYIALLAKSGAGAWVFKLTWRDERGDPTNTADVGIVGWGYEAPVLHVRPWPEGQPEFPKYTGNDLWINIDRIAEITVY